MPYVFPGVPHPEGEEVLVQSVYPVKVVHKGAEPCAFVCGVSERYWPSAGAPKEGAASV